MLTLCGLLSSDTPHVSKSNKFVSQKTSLFSNYFDSLQCNYKLLIVPFFLLLTGLGDANSPPTITSTEITSATEDSLYSYAPLGTDVDNDSLTWSGDVLPSWLSLKPVSSASTDFGVSIDGPGGVAIDDDGNVYIAERTGDKIYKILPGGTQTEFATVATDATDLKLGMLVIDRFLYIAHFGLGKITRINLSTPGVGETDYVSLPYPMAMVEKDGFIYVTQGPQNKISKIDLSNASVSDYVTGTDSPYGLAFASNGDLYINSQFGKYLSKFSNGTLTPEIISFSRFPLDLKLDANDNIYVSIYERGVKKISSDLSVMQDISETGITYGMTFNSAGTLIVGAFDDNKVITFQTSTTLTGTPTNEHVGVHDVNITLSDGIVDVVHNFQITVSNTNDAPVISGTPSTSVTEDDAYIFTPTVTDVDSGDNKTFSIINKPDWADFSTSAGTLTGTPIQENIGSTSGIVISVADNDNATDSIASFSITVTADNSAPVISGSPSTTVAEDAAYSFTPTVTDVDTEDTKTFSITNKPTWGTFNTSTGALTGTPSKTDAADYANIVISVSDSSNASASLSPFTLTVINSNQAPTVVGKNLDVDEDSELTIILTAEDLDGDTLTYEIVSQPENGQLTQSKNNTWTYTPTENYHGADSFTYKAMDAEEDSSAATVAITVASIDDAPIANDDEIVLTFSQNGRYVLDVLANDTDADADALLVINASSAIGTASVEAGQLIFEMQGVFEGDIELQYVISDGSTVKATRNKANVTVSFDSHVDTLLPVITLPDDINVNATGLFTKVNLGVATAIDGNGKTIPASLVDKVTRFEPGNNLVYWQAEDDNGFKRVVTQRVTVNPLINIGKDLQGAEGSQYKVSVYLNGESPTYPVTVAYSVSGDTDSADHSLVADELIIESGLVGYIDIDTLTDSIDESDETVIITLDDSVNLGTKSTFTLTITEDNVAPKVNVAVIQEEVERTLIDKSLGEVVISTEVLDVNTDDTHTYVWESSTGDIVDIGSDTTTFTFDPSNLAAGQQTLSLTVTDNGNTPLITEVFIYLDIVEALPPLTDIDSDGDLIADSVEGYGDADSDGIPDYLDNNNSSCNIQPENISENNLYSVESEYSTCIRRGVNTFNNDSGSLLLSADEVATDNEATNISGIFDFILSDIAIAGQSASVVLPLRLPIPESAIYRKLKPDTSWVEFVVDSKNYYSSSAGEQGYCPPPNNSSWSAGLTAGHWCVQLTIEDGGPNDDDGVANNQIIDPGGVAIWNSSNTLPTPQADQSSTTQNRPVSIDVLANDTDADGDTLSITSADVDFGTVTIVDGRLLYQPDTNFFGLAVINYGVADGNEGTGYADVTINVTENTDPVVVNDNASTDDRTAIIIDVLANDTDVDNDTLTIDSASTVQGSVVISNNSLIYTPLVGFDGTDIITYTIDDGYGGQASGSASVNAKAYQAIEKTTASGGGIGVIALFLGSLLMFLRGQKKGFLKILFSVAALFSLTTHAENNEVVSADASQNKLGWYIGGELGYGTTIVNKSDFDQLYQNTNIEANAVSVDNTDLTQSLFLGYQFNKYFALEAGYLNLGERSVGFTGNTLDTNTFYSNSESIYPQSGEGMTANLVAHYPFTEQLNLAGRLGYFNWEGDYQLTNTSGSVGSDSIKGTDLWYGAELNYRITTSMQVYFSATRYELARDKNNVAAIGIRYYFGSFDSAKKPQPVVVTKPVEKKIEPIVALDSDKDGVLDVNDNCANTNIQHQVDTSGCALLAEQVYNFNLVIYYAEASSDIPSSYEHDLQSLADFINKHGVKKLNVYGHTSASGPKKFNMKLSQKRAQSVADVLQARFNLDKSIINPVGRGEEDLIDSNNTDAAHQLNRRIEISIEETLMLPVQRTE